MDNESIFSFPDILQEYGRHHIDIWMILNHRYIEMEYRVNNYISYYLYKKGISHKRVDWSGMD